MKKILISTFPFGEMDDTPIKLLKQAGIKYTINPLGRKLKEDELAEIIEDHEVLIAGTEVISDYVMSRAKNLKLISRVGVGLDGVDLLAAKQRNINVSYTPEAPAPAVAELTIGLMLSVLRQVHVVNSRMHNMQWHRYFGRRISESTIGIIGAGRIGQRVIAHLQAFNPKILVNDISKTFDPAKYSKVQWAEKEQIYAECDLVSLHLPLTAQTRDLIGYSQLKRMKPTACIINTARGGIVNESDLVRVLTEGHLLGAAIDVFEQEPYLGDLQNIENCLLTSHMGSMSLDCRAKMEIEATEEAIRMLNNQILRGSVPISEYKYRQ